LQKTGFKLLGSEIIEKYFQAGKVSPMRHKMTLNFNKQGVDALGESSDTINELNLYAPMPTMGETMTHDTCDPDAALHSRL